MSKYEFTIDFDPTYETLAYYFTDDENKIVYTIDDEPVGIYNSENEKYPHTFGCNAVVEIEKVENDFDYNDITSENVNDYDWKIIDVCGACIKSIDCYENGMGKCDCICSKCGDFVKNCRYTCN